MKKVFAVLLTLAVAGGAFAQLSLNGEVKTGFGAVYDTRDGEHIRLVPFSKDAERWLGQFRLNGAYTSEDKNFGANFRFQVRDSALTPTLPFFFGWMNLFSNMVTVQAGLIDNGTYNLDNQIIDGDLGEGLGVLAHIRPIDNLSIGLGGYVGEGQPNNGLNSYVTNGTSAGYDIERVKYTIQAAYTMPDLLKVVGGFRTRGQKPETQTSWPSVLGDPETTTSSKAELEVMLLLVPGLTANLIGVIDNIGNQYFYDKDDALTGKGRFNIFGVFGYKLGDLDVGLNLGVYTKTMREATDYTDVFAGALWAKYALSDTIIPEVHLQYAYGTYGTRTSDGVIGKWHRKYFLNDDTNGGNYDSKTSYFSVRPAVTFKLDSKTTFEVGDLIHISLDSDDRLNGGQDGSLINNVAYIDFRWTF